MLDGQRFKEVVGVEAPAEAWRSPAAAEAARLVHLLAGVSYYKAAAAPVVDLAAVAVRPGERALIRRYYVDGLGEFAYRNGLDLAALEVVGGEEAGPPAGYSATAGPLVPFGGGIDSIVTVEGVRGRQPTAFVASRAGDRFAAIEGALAVTGLPVARASRSLDPEILRSGEHGWLNGHVPVTGVLSAVAVLAAVLGGHSAVVMSNEWSASVGNLDVGGRQVNHQWSKSLDFETDFRSMLAGAFELSAGSAPPDYFSWLRPWSELWVAERFATLERYHPVFRSCNRAFSLDPDRRLDHWCGRCDKCCFIDLVLAPFMPADRLREIFAGSEPLDDLSLLGRFESLVGSGRKPFECVGEEGECRAAAALAAGRPDRAASPVLGRLLADPALAGAAADAARLRAPLGPHHIPHGWLPAGA